MLVRNKEAAARRSEELKRIISESGLSVSEIARRIGVSRFEIYKYRTGSALPSPRRYEAIRHACTTGTVPVSLLTVRNRAKLGIAEGSGAEIRRIREQLGVTQQDLAAEFGKSQALVSCWENERFKAPDMQEIEEACKRARAKRQASA